MRQVFIHSHLQNISFNTCSEIIPATVDIQYKLGLIKKVSDWALHSFLQGTLKHSLKTAAKHSKT